MPFAADDPWAAESAAGAAGAWRGTGGVLLTVAFEGTRYQGFQLQPRRGDTVQARLEAAWERVTGAPARALPSGRTDAGVHAAALPVQFRAPCRIPLDRLPLALNAELPEDIVVRAARAVPAEFHARFDARGKTYVYNLWCEPTVPPFWARYAWHRPRPLDLEAMAEAARRLSGRHDFAAFGRAGRPVRDTVRTVRLRLARRGPLVTIWAEGDGFLYKMVRALVGTLVEVGRGAMRPDDVDALLRPAGAVRPAGRGMAPVAGPTAPARGLCLVEVRYDWGAVTGHDFIDILPRPSLE
ncbi:MAG: tRNA pseudouridine(38-40) synthase TruA [Firmicutes bacterium]|nr:tRNA pseudouridine(38-40) synthase TruA [Bacillota bacterium]